jgi:hypothetical protein
MTSGRKILYKLYMIQQLYVFALFLVIFNCSQTISLANEVCISAEQLRSQIEYGLKSKDTNGISSLVYWDGVSDEVKGMMIKGKLNGLFHSPVSSVIISTLPTNFHLVQMYEMRGVCQKYNIAVLGMINVKYQNGLVEQLPYGRKDDVFYIAGTILEKQSGKSLNINVLAGPNPDVLTFTGSWVYVTGGKEITVSISNATNRFKICWGDYIKSCTIQRTSTNSLDDIGFAGWFYYQVNEGGTNIFESSQITNEDSVIYVHH